MNDDLLQVDHVCFSYDGQAILRNVCMSIRKGELVSVVGKIGCGKSTLVRIVAGLLRPNTGSVCINGTCISGPTPDIAFLSGAGLLVPGVCVARNMANVLRTIGLSKQNAVARSCELLTELDISECGSLFPSQLSTGTRQLISFSLLAEATPKFLILDEPFSSMDEITRLRLGKAVSDRVTQESAGALLVTHSVIEAVRLSHRVVILAGKPSRVVQECNVSREHSVQLSNEELLRVSELLHQSLQPDYE